MCPAIKNPCPLPRGHGNLDAITEARKSDLHNHSLLGTRLENIESWAGAALRPAPQRMGSLDEMREYMHDALYPHILCRGGFEFTAESAIRDALADAVVLLEMSLDVRCARFYQSGLDGFFHFIVGLKKKYSDRISFRPEIGVSKNRDPEAEITIAMECVSSGVFDSIDLYGNEDAQPPEVYRSLYRQARKRGLKLKAHVGEFGSAELVLRTVAALDLDEVQHGIAAAASRPAMKMLRSRGIRLNVCPTSNVRLGVVEDISRHPIRALVDSGLRVTINSDDLAIFGQSVSQEYLNLYRARVLTAEELEEIRQEGLRGIGSPTEEQRSGMDPGGER